MMKGEGSLVTPTSQPALTSSRPISRAYVYSLIERVALLEQILEENGLTVPPADHPPETRHRSRFKEGTSSVENISSFATTPQESLISDEYAASSPSSPKGRIKEEYQLVDMKKRSLEWAEIDNASSEGSKRLRHDSLVNAALIKSESSSDRISDETINFPTRHETSFPIDEASIMPDPSQVPFWPMTYDHNGGLTTLYPDPQDSNFEHHDYGAWSNDTLGFQGYGNHTAIVCEVGNDILSREPTTNLDFMPLNANS